MLTKFQKPIFDNKNILYEKICYRLARATDSLGSSNYYAWCINHIYESYRVFNANMPCLDLKNICKPHWRSLLNHFLKNCRILSRTISVTFSKVLLQCTGLNEQVIQNRSIYSNRIMSFGMATILIGSWIQKPGLEC